MQNPFKSSSMKDFKMANLKLVYKQKDQAHHLIACARKIRKAFELHNFIYSSVHKEKQAAIGVSVDLSR